MGYNKHVSLVGEGYRLPFLLITFFFFLWGFARAVLDVLNPFFQQTFQINRTQAAYIQFAAYFAYFLMAIPAGAVIRKAGTRNGVIIGLVLFGLASLSFVLSRFADNVFGFYLSLLFVAGCGLACLEVAANPYVTLLGDPATAASRINRAQSFNGLGCIFGSMAGGVYCFSGDNPNISAPYIFIGVAALLVAALFSRVKLPELKDSVPAGKPEQSGGLAKRPMFLFGFFALFCYEAAEIAIHSFFINYATENNMTQWIGDSIRNIFDLTLNPHLIASVVLSVGLFLFMCGRFAGSWMMRFASAEKVLFYSSAGAAAMTALVVIDVQTVSFGASLLIFVFESIMFPTIFALSIKNLGSRTQKASAILMTTPVGGAVGTVLTGMAADSRNMTFSFLVPLIAFIVVLGYSAVVKMKSSIS